MQKTALGYRGVDADSAPAVAIHRGRFKTLRMLLSKWLKRSHAIEPAIGHTKSEHCMDRCWLQGAMGEVGGPVQWALGYPGSPGNYRRPLAGDDRLARRGHPKRPSRRETNFEGPTC